VTDKKVDVTGQVQKLGDTVSEFRDMVIKNFKDMDVEVKNWNFTVGQLEKEYTVEVNVKLCIKPKKA
jgi:hypothetical protein